MACIFGDICFVSAATVEMFYICMFVGFLLRRCVYFLNISVIRVFYRLNRNRALQVGIRAWLVLSRLIFVEFPVVCDMYGSTVGTCCVVLFF
jgi:hypothetical protein